MKIKCIEHVDDFSSNEHVCWAEVVDIPKQLVEEAKAIDGEHYCENCFGICVGCDEEGWYICQDSFDQELYYVDNDGEKYWMDYKLTEPEKNEAIEFCKKYLGEEA